MRTLAVIMAFNLVFAITTKANATSTEVYIGTATADKKIIYTEKHSVQRDDSKKLLSAKTEYYSPENQLLAVLESDFTSSLTAPNYTMTYSLTNEKEGLRRENGQLVMFTQEPGKSEKTKIVETSEPAPIVLACQGFNYYILTQLEDGTTKPNFKALLLAPGKLDSYNFNVQYQGEDAAGLAQFELSIDSWLLKIFAPSFKVKYDKNTKRIAWYEGLSNIKNSQGDLQKVEITYENR